MSQRFVTNTGAVIVILLIFWSPVAGQVFVDDFDDNVRGRVWSLGTVGSGPTMDEVNGRVEAALPPGSNNGQGPGILLPFNVFYLHRCALRGDYDVEVDYELLEWPSFNGGQLTLAAYPFSFPEPKSGVIASRTSGFALTSESYLSSVAIEGLPPFVLTPTADQSGSLRVTRTGSTVTGYYLDADGWKVITSGEVSTDDVSIRIHLLSLEEAFAGLLVRAAYDNFVITTGTFANCCGDGIVESTEECDDGNFDDGDGCSVDCEPEGPCAVSPLADCRSAAKNLLLIKNKDDDSKDKAIWKWGGGGATTQEEFGDPSTTTDYTLCLYAGSTAALVGKAEVVADAAKWKPISTKGYKYKDRDAGQGGVQTMLLKGSDQDKSKILVKGKGAELPDPVLPMESPVVVQLVNSDTDVCWESSFDEGDIGKNEVGQFKAKR